MSFTPDVWADFPQGGTLVTAAKLDKLGTQYAAALQDGGVPQGIIYPAGAALGNVTIEALQAACNEAFSTGKKVLAAGSITTNATLMLKCNADLSGLTLNYTGALTAVILGDTAESFRLSVHLPKVLNANKAPDSGGGWTAGTIGVSIVNLVACAEVFIPYVRGFETGVRIYGQGHGNAYNTYTLGHLDNNKVNMSLDADGSGWANQNTFIGGRLSHDSIEGAAVSGARHILMVAGLANSINNNTWIAPSVEGETTEYIVAFAGSYNVIINGRYEQSGPRIFWQNGSSRNLIQWGYNAHNIVETFGTTASGNAIMASAARYASGGATALQTMENTSSSANPIIALMEAGQRAAGGDPLTAYSVHLGTTISRFKRAADAFDRLQIDAQNGRLYFGSGTVAPARYFDNLGTTSVRLNAAHLAFGTDNANDIGLAAANRPRYVRIGTGVQVGVFATGSRPTAATAGAGTMILDSTLNKPIWSDGTVWRDATGASV